MSSLSPNTVALINTAALVLIAGLNALTAWMAHRTRKDVRVLEENTNSIKDALVASTAKASRAQGRREGVESMDGLAVKPKS